MAKPRKPTAADLPRAEIIDEIIRRVSEGESLKSICRTPGFPKSSTFRMWVVENVGGLYERYARARESQAEAWQDDILDFSDDNSRDTIEGEDGRAMCNHEWIARSRLKVDTRKWLMAKLHPRQYGERLDIKSDNTHRADDSMISMLRELRQVRPNTSTP